jgi:hypothetical protein
VELAVQAQGKLACSVVFLGVEDCFNLFTMENTVVNYDKSYESNYSFTQ